MLVLLLLLCSSSCVVLFSTTSKPCIIGYSRLFVLLFSSKLSVSLSCMLCLSIFILLCSFRMTLSNFSFLFFILVLSFFQLSNDFFVHFSVSIVSFLLVNFSWDYSYFFSLFFHSLLFLFIHLQHLSISLSVLCFSCSFVFSLFLLFPLLA